MIEHGIVNASRVVIEVTGRGGVRRNRCALEAEVGFIRKNLFIDRRMVNGDGR